MRPPPCLQLFPYTTLFRSAVAVFSERGSCHMSAALSGFKHHLLEILVATLLLACSGAIAQENYPSRPNRDRKSTRLNSSHLGISYAALCYKKNIRDPRVHL